MTRLLLRLTGISVLVWCLALSGSLVTGRMMPPVPLAVFMTMLRDNTLLISRIDTRLRVAAGLRIRSATEYPYAIDPGCRVLFPLRLSGQLRLAYLDLTTDERRSYANEYSPTGYAEWLPDGQRVWAQYTAGPENVRRYVIVDTLGGENVPVPLTDLEREAPVALYWSPDSATGLIYGWRNMQNSYTYLVNTHTGGLTPVDTGQSHIFRWSPDSRYLVAQTAAHLLVLDAARGVTVRRFERVHYGTGMAWTPDNHLLFLAQSSDSPQQYQGYIWRPETDTLQKSAVYLPVFNFSYSVLDSAWSPDGTKLLYEDRRSRVHILDTVSGMEIASVPAPDKDGFRVYLWSPDSRYLVSYNNYPEVLVFTDTQTNQKTYFSVTVDPNTLAAFAAAWRASPEPGFFERRTSTLRRLTFHNGTPELTPEYQLPGAYLGAFCDAEAA